MFLIFPNTDMSVLLHLYNFKIYMLPNFHVYQMVIGNPFVCFFCFILYYL